MKLKFVLFSALSLCSVVEPSWSEDEKTLFDRYIRSLEAVIGTASKPTNYRNMILDNLSGNWFPMSSLAPEKNEPEVFGKMCGPKGLRAIAIKVLNDYSFEAVRVLSETKSFSTVYTARLGNEFGTYTDIAVLLDLFGVGSDMSPNAASARMADKLLGENNGTVLITRPYEDILVFQSRDNPLSLWARCPVE